MPKKALLMIDLQNDFCEGGTLAVPQGDEVIDLANRLQNQFGLIIASKDWHPETHSSFASNHNDKKVGDVIYLQNTAQMLWPSHCVQNTHGAEFHPALKTHKISQIFFKGADESVDSYSAFFDNEKLRETGLATYLKLMGVEELHVMGLATDYCVKFSCLDAVELGFKVFLIEDACRGVGVGARDIENALLEMYQAGVIKARVDEYLAIPAA